MNEIDFSFTDMIAGYVETVDPGSSFLVRTSDGRRFQVELTEATTARLVRNLGSSESDAPPPIIAEALIPGRLVYAYGIFYAVEKERRFEAKELTFPSLGRSGYVFEQPDWWVNQARQICDFYLQGQFPDGKYDWRNYRTKLYLNGTHLPENRGPDYRAETDTISRLVYGLATTYMLTGEDRFLEAAEGGAAYLREHLRQVDQENDVVYWLHGVDVSGDTERGVLASEFGDDFDALPAYEQIYALAGPTQVFRVTGDREILHDIERTIRLFDEFYADRELGGYFSHVDPIMLDPRADSLGRNRARKNWNSIGDHAPAYLINALLATGRQEWSDFLVRTSETILERFPDYENSPFVQERFYEDWSKDESYAWQQNNAVVGHNLKIAWNLMRVHHHRPNQALVDLAQKIAGLMPSVGSDQQRGGWYDVVDREIPPGETKPRFVWHNRKAWWQQEQGILAYLILAGSIGDPEYLRLARESASFYNAMFPDHDDGGVYFNVLATGVPYLVGNERLKGNHSMSGYHSIELCYLSTVYINLLISNVPVELHFKPRPGAFPDNILRVAPDLLPKGRVRLSDVWIDDQQHKDFDPEQMTVQLPVTDRQVRVRVRIDSLAEKLQTYFRTSPEVAELTLRGQVTEADVPMLADQLQEVIGAASERVVIIMKDLLTICEEGVRQLVFLRQKQPVGEARDFIVVGANPRVRAAVEDGKKAGSVSGGIVFVDDLSAQQHAPSSAVVSSGSAPTA